MQAAKVTKHQPEPEPTWDELKREHEEERETSYNPDDERDAMPARFAGWR